MAVYRPFLRNKIINWLLKRIFQGTGFGPSQKLTSDDAKLQQRLRGVLPKKRRARESPGGSARPAPLRMIKPIRKR